MTLATLSDAIDWARDRWANQRSVPTRLHTREEEGTGLMRDRKGCGCLACTGGAGEASLGSHAFSHAFASALDGKPDITEDMGGPTDCYHPLLKNREPARECPECFGMGVKDHRSVRFVYPMSRALDRLSQAKNTTPRQPHPYGLVMVLAGRQWDARKAAEVLGMPWDRAEALFLLALRKLHSRYDDGPTETRVSSWVDLSDSQRAAISESETAA